MKALQNHVVQHIQVALDSWIGRWGQFSDDSFLSFLHWQARSRAFELAILDRDEFDRLEVDGESDTDSYSDEETMCDEDSFVEDARGPFQELDETEKVTFESISDDGRTSEHYLLNDHVQCPVRKNKEEDVDNTDTNDASGEDDPKTAKVKMLQMNFFLPREKIFAKPVVSPHQTPLT